MLAIPALKTALLYGIEQVATFLPTAWLQAITQQGTLLPFYHVISDTPLNHIRHLYAVKNSKEFVQDLDFLCRHYTPISVVQLKDAVYKGTTLPKRCFLLTFDDGLAQCHDIIAPILLQKGIPATFFLNSAFIDNQALMFRYKASLLIEEGQKQQYTLSNLAPFFASAALPLGNTLAASLLAVRWQHQAMLDKIAAAWQVNFEQFLKEKQPYLTTLQIQKMQHDGFDFGSHSINHPTYHTLPLREQIAQTTISQAHLQEHFHIEAAYFAFPFTDFGVKKDFFEHILEQQNFQLTFGGAGIKNEKIKGHLQRLGLEGNQNRTARTLVHTAYCYYIIKAFFGKNTIHR